MIFFKVKAGALQFTMFVVVVIALLLAAFIILIHTHKTFKVQTNFTIETAKNADYGIHYALHNSLQLNDTVLVNLNDESYKTLKVHRHFWGLYEHVTTISKIKNKQIKKIALIGSRQPEVARTALYLEEHNRPLVVVGKTRIQGVAYLPKQGVRTGNISGHSYYGKALIYGVEKTSDALPKLHLEALKQIKEVTKLYKGVDSDQFLDIGNKRVYQNSFYKPLQIIFNLGTINLSGASLTGHILVQSKTKIIVDASSKLKDVVLIAPIIEIKSHVKGVFQAFAAKEISVGKHVKLDYPSALVLNEATSYSSNPDRNKENPFIKINESSKIKGAVVYQGHSKSYKSHVFINEKVTVIGEVYCNQNLELLGTVYGSVYTSGFVANQSGSVYQNHVYNGTIIADKLPQEYAGLLFQNSNKALAKWLY